MEYCNCKNYQRQGALTRAGTFYFEHFSKLNFHSTDENKYYILYGLVVSVYE
jgi:hypothetical protein